ncbi:MAG: hypothetical protein ACYDC3_07460 [Candidatus Binataceae bacterium]
MDRIIAAGAWGTIEWAVDGIGSMPACNDYEHLPTDRKAKILALFENLAAKGLINNRQKFHKLGPKGGRHGSELREFKSYQDRFLGDYRPGFRFLVAAYEQKKTDRLSRGIIERAVRVLAENDRYEASHGH